MMAFLLWRSACIFFLWCAYVQWNDPDPWFWIPIYTGNAIMIELAARRLTSRFLSIIILGMGLIGAIVFFPREFHGFFGDMNSNMQIEKARESMGLMIIAISHLILICIDIHREKQK